MTLNFVMLLAATLILRYLAIEANATFLDRMRHLLPLNVFSRQPHLLRELYGEKLGEFRSRALPYDGLHLLLNTLACCSLLLALWLFPPACIAVGFLSLIKASALAVVPVAFVVDAARFCRVLYVSFSCARSPSEQ